GTKLDQVHGLPGAHLHDRADPICEADGVLRLLGHVGMELRPQCFGALHRLPETVLETGEYDVWGKDVAVQGTQGLPLHREHSMALEIPEGAVVGQHVEPVRDSLERAA